MPSAKHAHGEESLGNPGRQQMSTAARVSRGDIYRVEQDTHQQRRLASTVDPIMIGSALDRHIERADWDFIALTG
jgi:hypothetical protein